LKGAADRAMERWGIGDEELGMGDKGYGGVGTWEKILTKGLRREGACFPNCCTHPRPSLTDASHANKICTDTLSPLSSLLSPLSSLRRKQNLCTDTWLLL
jgi:hypothetical protein